MPDLTSDELQGAASDEDYARVVRMGRGLMPGFADSFTERGIAAIVAHVRTLRASARPASESEIDTDEDSTGETSIVGSPPRVDDGASDGTE